MKINIKKVILASTLVVIITGCKQSFLELTPQGQLTPEQLVSQSGVEQLLIGSYGMLNGNRSGTWGNYASAPSNWLLGEVTSDNAHKGSNNDDITAMNDLERHVPNSTNGELETFWIRFYEGVISCNNTLSTLATLQATNGPKFTDQRATEVQAEARLLRAHYYFQLRRVFVNVPYLDENVTIAEAPSIPNNTDIYTKIEDDLKYAVDNLPVAKPFGEVGRVDKKIAQAYLAKVLLYQNRHSEALPLFENVIDASGDLVNMPFQNNFQIATENGPEVVFAVKHEVASGVADNANVGDMLAGYYGSAPVTCCGFYQPTVDLINAFKVDANGLPLLDNSYRTDANVSDLLSPGDKSTYKLDTTLRVDPRLDYTVARRGVMFRDWGLMPGDGWIRDPAFGGPFLAQKHTINMSEFAGNTQPGENYITSLDVNLIRLGDVYLMAAECYAEAEELDKARDLVNKVRERAGKLAAKKTFYGNNAAEYQVGQYTSFTDKTHAVNAIRFERRLELALEGHRFYDLVRWGIAKNVIESYSAFESQFLPAYSGIVINSHNNYFPIPQNQIDRSAGAVEQNIGY